MLLEGAPTIISTGPFSQIVSLPKGNYYIYIYIYTCDSVNCPLVAPKDQMISTLYGFLSKRPNESPKVSSPSKQWKGSQPCKQAPNGVRALFSPEFLKRGLEPIRMAAADDVDSAPWTAWNNRRSRHMWNITSEITLVKLLNSIVYPCNPKFSICVLF